MKKATGKRIFALIIAIAMIVTMFLASMIDAFAYTETTGTVTNENVKVRQSASTTASQVASLKKGDVIDIIDEETDSSGYVWYKIRVNKSEQGYVRSDLVNKAGGSSSSSNNKPAATEETKTETKTETKPAATAPEVTDTESKSAIVTQESVNVRKAAGKDFDAVGKVVKNNSVTVTGEAKGTDGKTWYRIQFGDGKEGFVRSDLIEIGGTAEAATEPAPAPAESTDAPEATEAPAEDGAEEGESEGEESEDAEAEEPQEEEQAAPAVVGDGAYALDYIDDVWYLNDYGAGQRVKVKELIDVANTAPKLDKKAKNFKLIAIGLGALAGILLIAVIILALKLREAMYYEDDEDEDEYDRFADSRRRRARDDEEDEEERFSSRRDRASRDDDRASRRQARPETSRRSDDERTVRPETDDRQVRPSRPSEDRPSRPRRSDDEYDRPSRRSAEDRPSRPSRDSYRDAEAEAPRRRAKNFIGDDDDFEFEFLDLDDDK